MMTILDRSESQTITLPCVGDRLNATDLCMGEVDGGEVFGLDDAQVIYSP